MALALGSGCVETEVMQATLRNEKMDDEKFKMRLEVLISRLSVKLSP